MQHILDQTSVITNRISVVEIGAFNGSRGDVDIIRQTASVIAAVAGGGTVHYLDHSVATQDGQNDGHVVIAYTDEALIVQHLEDVQGVWRLASIDVYARHSLTQIQPQHIANAIDATAENWPDRIEILVEYAGGPSYRLPFHTTGNPELRRELAKMLPSLTADLNAAR